MLLAAGLAAAQGPELVPVPRPGLGAMEEAVARQLAEQRQLLDTFLADSDPAPMLLAESFGRTGQLYQAYALTAAAQPCFENASRLVPEDFRWQYYLGAIHQDAGRQEAALAALEAARGRRGDDVPTLLRLGQLHLDRGETALAGPLYARALELDPESAAASYGLGRVAAESGDLAAAVARYEQALVLQPRASRVHYVLGQAYRRLGDAEKAREHLEQGGRASVAFRDPLIQGLQSLTVSASAALGRGGDAQLLGLDEVALEEYQKAVEADPENPAAHEALASILAQTRDSAGAIRHFRQALSLSPNRPETQFLLGYLLAQRGETGLARSHFEKAAELDPRFTMVRLALASLLLDAGRLEEAEARYREVLAIGPSNADAQLQLGRLALEQGDIATGMERLEAVIASDTEPENKAQAHLYKATVELRRGAADAALAQLRRAVEADADLAQAHLQLGQVLLGQRAFAEAVPALRRGLELAPDNAEARLGLMSALVLAGELREALDLLEEGVRRHPRNPLLAYNLARLLACSPRRDDRNGQRALELAQGLFQARSTLEHGETLAMALAEAGQLEDAAGLQTQLLAEAQRLGREALAAQLEKNLERYRRQETCELSF